MAFNPNKCMCFVAEQSIWIQIFRSGGCETAPMAPIYCSTNNGASWMTMIPGSNYYLSTGQKMFLRSTGRTAISEYGWTSFDSNGKFHVEGQITSLLNDGEGGDVPLTDNYCFAMMFWGADYLTSVPSDFLPSTSLSPNCYYRLFYDIPNFQTPEPIILPAKTLVTNCYKEMFKNTSLVDKIKVGFSSWVSGATSDWVSGVSRTGTFICQPALPANRGNSNIPSGWVIDYSMDKCLKFKALANNCTISLPPSQIDGSHYQFSKDGKTWQPDSITLNNEETCYVKGTNYPTTTVTTGMNSFTISAAAEIESGNIMSLVDDGAGEATIPGADGVNGFFYLFKDCVNLKAIPSVLLPCTELTLNCYQGLFYNCSGLTVIPDGLLPATNLVNGCYKEMFYGCTGLTCIQENCFPATTLKFECYQYMFANCSSLNEIHVPFEAWGSGTTAWVTNVASEGDFYCSTNLPEEMGDNRIPTNWRIHKKIPLTNCLKFKALADNCTIEMGTSYVDSSHYQFSKDGEIWQNDSITLNNGETCYLKGTNYPCISSQNQRIKISAPAEIISGNLMSLVDNGAGELTEITQEWAFQNLFYYQTNLKAIPENLLPATTLTTGCYYALFYHSGLASLPQNLLPALILTEKCYACMFEECDNLTSIPLNFLPALTLAKNCYYRMFGLCHNLAAIPEGLLPATTMVELCYSAMFMNCTKLTRTPKKLLPATTLAYCCYSYMFGGCSSLKEITVPFEDWGSDNATYNWVDGVANSGTFYCPGTLEKIYDVSHIPTNWRTKPNMNIYYRSLDLLFKKKEG